jgi:hypothetical protein
MEAGTGEDEQLPATSPGQDQDSGSSSSMCCGVPVKRAVAASSAAAEVAVAGIAESQGMRLLDSLLSAAHHAWTITAICQPVYGRP